ncbi:hypothetical protein THRCLA_21529 [Thraustotheca clavata]|uniref:Uncharacterized protein n=1 Tax=Thraustotheca clavata TaxID=74557 RepID=A0A1V9ZVF7_9STRA|nr:hypothetical protein THRCLA_21529 [Thraustotheca clavata]
MEQLNTPEDMAKALAFVDKSYALAKRCMELKQYGCAFRILVKIEATTRLIAKESRRGILSKVNQKPSQHDIDNQDEEKDNTKHRRKVSFSDDVHVGEAQDIDRSVSPVAPPSVEEMLFVRASRDIPTQNYSMYWTLDAST